ncbi:hypothetical protein Hanom_Chr14g01290471 [Helianthus anomalus]
MSIFIAHSPSLSDLHKTYMNNKSTIQTQINAKTSRLSNKTQMNRTVVGSATTAPAAPAPLRSAPLLPLLCRCR